MVNEMVGEEDIQ
jgi:hypothetical protein